MSLLHPLTFLDMLQRLHLETGTSGTSPGAVSGQADQITRLTMWLSSAWVDIQMANPDAAFLRQSITFALSNGVYAYSPQTIFTGSAPATNGYTVDEYFGHWKLDTARIYTTASGTNDEFPIEEIEYDRWRDEYLLGALRNSRTRPIVVADGPLGHELYLGPVPNGNYTMSTDFFLSPQPLIADTDTPSGVLNQIFYGNLVGTGFKVPSQYNMMIVYKAMMDYGSYEGAPEVYNRGELGYNKIAKRLSMKERPVVKTGGPLA